MKKIVENPNIFFCSFVGIGTTGIVLRKKDQAIKFYYDKNFKNDKIKNKLLSFTNLNTKNFIFPKEIIVKNGELKGYITNYIRGYNMSCFTDNLYYIIENIDKIINDIKIISDNRIILRDITSKDILYNDNNIYFIDLDKSKYEFDLSKKEIFKINLITVRDTMFKSILFIPDEYSFKFEDNIIQEYYDNSIKDYAYVIELTDYIINKEKTKNIKELRKRIKINSYFDEYHYKY